MKSTDGFRFSIDSRTPRNSFRLNGIWELAPSSDDSGPPDTFSHQISVPGIVGCARPLYPWQEFRFHWYRTRFTLEGDLLPVAFLRIGQSQFGTHVWMNNVHVGESISCYTSQEYDVRSHLQRNENELVIRVGMKKDLPPSSAVGNDQEKQIYTPGIWGDVWLVQSGNPRIVRVQTIPDVNSETMLASITLENRGQEDLDVVIEGVVKERRSGKQATAEQICSVNILRGTGNCSLQFSIPHPTLWTPESPFLYVLAVRIKKGDQVTDELETTFGMRDFRISGNQFLLNGKRIFLKGGNIAFHRFLADKECDGLPWDPDWIRRVLIEIPKGHNFNFFRNHLGQLYSHWYDVADEGGMLIQNEWHFWGTSGSREQIRKELTEWIQDNWNHPSIVIWDPLNESSDETLQREIIPELRKIDPTRIWESVDFVEEHPYIYSLGPVLNEGRFGFSRSIREIEESKTPAVLNEFLWWWLDSLGTPTSLMEGVTERWLGTRYTQEDLLVHQAFLAAELVELLRRMRAAAIQPFVYLSNDDGPTGHWFLGPIATLQPKPVLAALRNAFAPFGVSIELWDRHFFPGEQRNIRIVVFNDEPQGQSGRLTYGIMNAAGRWISKTETTVDAAGSSCVTVEGDFELPMQEGPYDIRAEIAGLTGMAFSRKIAHVFNPHIPSNLDGTRICLFGAAPELAQFLNSLGIEFSSFSKKYLRSCDILVIPEGDVRTHEYAAILPDVGEFVDRGGTLIVLEPEKDLDGAEEVRLTENERIRLNRREDVDRGGYDSYVFMDDPSHPMWAPLVQDHLKMFNGGFGGEIVSQHDLAIVSPHRVHARCGLRLGVVALAEIASGQGKILISRLQTRGRLVGRNPGQLYDRRQDPIAQQYMLQLLSYASPSGTIRNNHR